MLRRMIGAVVGFGICVGTLSAFEVLAVLRKIDAEQRVVVVAAGGQDRTVQVAKDAKFLDGVEMTLTVERAGNEPVIRAIQLGKKAGSSPTQGTGITSVGFKPLTEMMAQDKYQGEDGGLYGGGENEPPKAHQAAARKETSKVVPLDAEGKPSNEGKIVVISISMSNATRRSHYILTQRARSAERPCE